MTEDKKNHKRRLPKNGWCNLRTLALSLLTSHFSPMSRNVWILSLVSLFTDMASEMLYPIMPVYLKSIGFSIVFIGILEGVAEAVAGLSKGYFGHKSDTMGRRLPFVQIGYGLSALSKPMMAAFAYPLWVFFARTTDRLGKGIRTGARDALLSDEATPATKGRVFGFHRSLDTLGAVIGPLMALLFLQMHPGAYRTLFLIAFLPGALAIVCTWLVRERSKAHTLIVRKTPLLGFYTLLAAQSGAIPPDCECVPVVCAVQQFGCISSAENQRGGLQRQHGDRNIHFLQPGICLVCLSNWNAGRPDRDETGIYGWFIVVCCGVCGYGVCP